MTNIELVAFQLTSNKKNNNSLSALSDRGDKKMLESNSSKNAMHGSTNGNKNRHQQGSGNQHKQVLYDIYYLA